MQPRTLRALHFTSKYNSLLKIRMSALINPNKKRRMGRPPSSPDKVRRNRVVTMVTDAEFAQLKSLAEAEGKSLSLVVYAVLSRYLKRRSSGIQLKSRTPVSEYQNE